MQECSQGNIAAGSGYALLIDVGNTNTKIGVAREDAIVDSFVLPTDLEETADTFGFKVNGLCRCLGVSLRDVKSWVVSSVVPPVDQLLAQAGERFGRLEVQFVPRDIPVPLHNRYANPREVGADRLVTSFAARRLFEQPNLIVIDFGTATTVECVCHDEYLGGFICPGVFSSLRALAVKTAKLPRISLDIASSKLEIGVSTETSMNQGFVFGFASMIEGLCSRLKRELRGEVQVVATGGFARKIALACSAIDVVQEDLLLKGLLFLWQDQLQGG